MRCLKYQRYESITFLGLPVERKVRRSKNAHFSHEIAFFVSNKELKKNVGIELFTAARGHWNVESDNYVRDLTMGEDDIKCKESSRIRMIASTINNVLNRIRCFDTGNNIRAFREKLIFNSNFFFGDLFDFNLIHKRHIVIKFFKIPKRFDHK